MLLLNKYYLKVQIVNKAVELIPAVKDKVPNIPSIPDPEKVTEILKDKTKEVIDETIDKAVDKAVDKKD